MLSSLHIENIAVIKRIDIDLSPGFTVLTGETGAGKSIIIDSINLLLGARGAKELIRTGETGALVTACFSDINENAKAALFELGITPDEDGLIYIQRTLSSDGKSQARLNGRVIPSQLQRDIGRILLSIHGQHDNQTLLVPQNHIDFLDRYGDCNELLSEYSEIYDRLRKIESEISSISKNEQEKARLTELLQYQIRDIDSAKLKDGEEELLLAQRKKLQNIEKIAKNTNLVYRALWQNEKGASAGELIKRAQTALAQLESDVPEANAYSQRLDSVLAELEDIAESVRAEGAEDIADPSALLTKIENRLEIISRLERKYGASIRDILDYREKSYSEYKAIESSEERLCELTKEREIVLCEAEASAEKLAARRRECALTLETRVMEELAFLEMGKVTFKVDIRRTELSRKGGDDVEFMISTNRGDPPKPLAKIASGGELSRIMLAMKNVLADKDNTDTSIFDEVDVGVSGKTSQKIGILLRNTARATQVICITHSAQIAALADNHLLISKGELDGRANTSVMPLDREGRIGELARIMGGAEITDNLIKTACELLDAGEK